MAGKVTAEEARKLVQNNPNLLAPKFGLVVQKVQVELHNAGHEIQIYETLRSDQLARMYFELGVSKARNAWHTWHFYGLAVDVIHPVHGWDWWPEWHAESRTFVSSSPEADKWYKAVVAKFKEHGCDWGGDWKSIKDCPHFQWGPCRPSPSERSVELYHQGGIRLVWDAVGAL